MKPDRIRVLLIEDDEDDYTVLRKLLSEIPFQKYDLEWVATYSAALEGIGRHEHDVYLLDYYLGERNGFELLQEEVAKECKAPIILLTGNGNYETDLQAMKIGVADYLAKDQISASLLERSIRYAIEQKSINEKLKAYAAELEGKIEERKRAESAEEALIHSEIKFRSLIENASDIISILDAEGRIVYHSPSAERILGYTTEELRESMGFELIHPADIKEVTRTFKSILQAPGNLGSAEFRFLHKNGSWRTIEGVGRNLLHDPSVAGIVINARDITGHRDLEKQLRQAQKMEAVGTLAGGIAHDFNNILSPIMGYTEIAMNEIPEGSPLQHYMHEVLRASNRAKELVKQILSFSRQTEHELKPVRISLIVREALKLLRASLPSTIEIRQEIAPEAKQATALTDPTHIHQIMINLCTNAAHAMQEKGGVLSIRLASMEIDSAAASQHPDMSPGPYLRLTVADTGHGMGEAVRLRIFEPYYTTKGAQEGTGLGLAVVYGIVKSCKGAISVSSEAGKGSTFHVYFPRTEARSEKRAEEAATPVPMGSERIFFVDDEKVIAEAAKSMLEDLGYQVTAGIDSVQALAAFRAQSQLFDLVITDQTMPHLTGVDLSRELLHIRPDIPIILCTGFSGTVTEDIAKKMGISELVMKPFGRRQIAEVIRKALNKAQN